MLFQSIPGRNPLKQQLIQGIRSDKVPHAQIFSSEEGSGGLAFALAYAQYLFCKERGESDSCGQCSSCMKVGKLIHPDLHFSFPFASNKKEDTAGLFMGPWREQVLRNPFFTLENWIDTLSIENKMVNIPVSECRQIIKELSLKAYEGGYQILILWLPEFLRESANILLKLLEEPSPGTLFLLVSENREHIIPTLLSRTQLIQVPALTLLDAQNFLEEKFQLDENLAETIAFLSEGNLSRAEALVRGSVDHFRETFEEWLSLILEGNGGKLVEWVEAFNGKTQKSTLSKEDKKNFLLYSIKTFRKIYFSTYEGKPNPLKISIGPFQNLIGELERAIYHLERNSNPKILFLDVSLQLSRLILTQK